MFSRSLEKQLEDVLSVFNKAKDGLRAFVAKVDARMVSNSLEAAELAKANNQLDDLRKQAQKVLGKMEDIFGA